MYTTSDWEVYNGLQPEWLGGWVGTTHRVGHKGISNTKEKQPKVIPPKIANGTPAAWDKMEHHPLQAGLATTTGLVLGFVGEQENYVYKIIFCRLG